MKFMLLFIFALFLLGCPHPYVPVAEWIPLQQLDAQVTEVKNLLEEELESEAVEEHLQEIQEAIQAVVEGGVPAYVEQKELVEQKLLELESLSFEIGHDPAALEAMAPLLVSLKEAAGIADPCPHCGGHHHDHDDHGDHHH